VNKESGAFILPLTSFINKAYDVIYQKLKFRMRTSNPKIRIAKSTMIHSTALLNPEFGWIEIGAHSTVNEFCSLHGAGGIRIGDGVRIGCHTVIHSVEHHFRRLDVPIWKQGTYAKPIVINDDVWVGANCTIIGGVTIGAHSIIGAHSLVTKDVPPYSVAYGVPAKIRRSRKDNDNVKRQI
jgi:acetyltransferase-like isoleucine patch superfamily enzyme